MNSYERLAVAFARSRPGAWLFVNVLTRVDRVVLRISKGRLSTGVGTCFHPHVALLTTTGVRTGRPRTVPLLATLDGDDVVLIASKGGHPRHPAWYANLRTNPRVTVTLGGRITACLAREAEGSERERLWMKAIALYPGYADYQARTARRIPVIVLSPVMAATASGSSAPPN